MPVNGRPRKYDYAKLAHMYIDEKKTSKEIADEYGVSVSTMKSTLSRLGISKNGNAINQIVVSLDREYYKQEAQSRNITTEHLINKLLRIIARDKLATAILDDDD